MTSLFGKMLVVEKAKQFRAAQVAGGARRSRRFNSRLPARRKNSSVSVLPCALKRAEPPVRFGWVGDLKGDQFPATLPEAFGAALVLMAIAGLHTCWLMGLAHAHNADKRPAVFFRDDEMMKGKRQP